MSITKTVVGRPTTLIIIFTLLIGLGIYAALDLPLDLFPEINPPILLVFTTYEGAGPEEIEKLITRPLEGAVSNVSNIDSFTSSSSEGSSQIIIEFTYGTDMAEAANDVRDKMEFVKGFLPEESNAPQIFKFDPSIIPILSLMVTGTRSSEELRQIAEDIVQPRLEQVDGVAMAGVEGGREKAIRVEIPQNRLEAYDLSLTQVAGMLRGQNVQLSAGTITEGDKNYLLRTSGEYRNINEIKNTVVAYRGGATPQDPTGTLSVVRLRDIANVYEGFKRETSAVFINREPGVYVTVQKQSGTNSVRTADNVKERLTTIQEEIPSGVSIEIVMDTTDMIRNSLSQVSTTLLLGGVLAVVILLLFLRSFKSTIIVGLSIPISFIITLMLMYFFGLTLNLMTLGGLALGVGMLVDNSIVILENIYRYREKGAKLTASAILGSQEMINAVVASTLTTICVFAPMVLFRSQLGIYGEVFSGLSFTVVISLSSSLLVAILLIPVLASRYLPIRTRTQRPLKGPVRILDNALAWVFQGLERIYKAILRWVFRHKILTLIFIALIFLSSLLFISFTGFELFPGQAEPMIQVDVELPIGTKLEVTKSMMRQLEMVAIEEIRGYKDIIISSGGGGFFGLFGSSTSNTGTMTITLPDFENRIDNSTVIQEKLRRHFNDFPSAVFSFAATQGTMMMGGSPIDILIRTNDLDSARETANRIRDLIDERVPEVTEPTVDFKEGLPQIEILVDRDKAYSLGLNIYTIGQEIRANIDGITASRFREGGSEYDIELILDQRDRDALPDLNKVFVMSAFGQRIPLSSFARLERTSGPISIQRENQTRVVHVTGGITPGARLNLVEPRIRQLITDEIPPDENLTITFSGEYADLLNYGRTFIIILIISVILVFGVMAAQFESFLDPFIILFTVPLLLIGVIAINVGTGENFSLITAVGMVMLVGIVVNNGIVLVDYTNLLRKRGLSIVEACIEAGGNRLRPVLMTALTTMLALIPMAFSKGEGAELLRPLGKTVVGGLATSTLLTLFLIPVIYAIVNRFSEKRRVKRETRRERRLQKQLAAGGAS